MGNEYSTALIAKFATLTASAPHPEQLSALDPAYDGDQPEIKQADERFAIFTSGAVAIHREVDQGRSPSAEEIIITNRLDEARAWVTYFSPDGTLCKGLAPDIPLPVRIGYLTHIAKLHRIAHEWVDYFDELHQKTSYPQKELDAEEQTGLRQLRDAAQTLNARVMFFTLSSGNVSSQTIQGYINELYNFIATFQAWRSTANQLLNKGRPAYSEELERLITKVNDKLAMFQYTYRSRYAFERFQIQQGLTP